MYNAFKRGREMINLNYINFFFLDKLDPWLLKRSEYSIKELIIFFRATSNKFLIHFEHGDL